MRYLELQCDGLVGPTHNYAGLSHGNVASAANALSISSPRKAALQGLEKMRLVTSLGVPQWILPPQLRPNLHLLAQLGFHGSVQDMLDAAWRADPKLLYAAWSASAMWAANAATVSPAPDTENSRLHLTPANLATTVHRQQEAASTYAMLEHVFGGVAELHEPLPACVTLTDEGAANHMRLSQGQGGPGVEIFVYGRNSGHPVIRSSDYPVRQTLAASQAVARLHGVRQAVFVQQQPAAIDAGVFHNDVIAMSNEHLLVYHERAFVEEEAFLAELRAAFPLLEAIRISERDLPLAQAVSSYFFNSQLLSLPSGGMAILAPAECAEIPAARAMLERLPVEAVHYLDVRESMRNGGGPACLRLRVVMEEEALAALPQAMRYSEAQHQRLAACIERMYPERMTPDDLRDGQIAAACLDAMEELEKILELP